MRQFEDNEYVNEWESEDGKSYISIDIYIEDNEWQSIIWLVNDDGGTLSSDGDGGGDGYLRNLYHIETENGMSEVFNLNKKEVKEVIECNSIKEFIYDYLTQQNHEGMNFIISKKKLIKEAAEKVFKSIHRQRRLEKILKKNDNDSDNDR